MICLDTNYLIRSLVENSAEASDLVTWARSGESLVTPMVAWYEFLCGPVNEEHVQTVRGFLSEVIPFDERQAEEAARLINATGRKRSLRIDATIAGCAITANAKLATDNRNDFELFRPCGLQLV